MTEVHPESVNHVTKLIRNIQPGEEIVISGISGAFPDADNVHQFRENLFNKYHMPDKNRWETFKHSDMPSRLGMVPNIEKYDAGYFGVQTREAHSMDPMSRILNEKTIEAIMDAGLHPSDLENTNTGVYIGSTSVALKNFVPGIVTWTGNSISMQAHRLSYTLKLRGPSLVVDTACSSSLIALATAFRALMLGEIDSAIVGGTSLCVDPILHLQFAKLGVLSMDGACKVFDKAADGYVRSEAISVMVLQKLKNAKRSYAQIIHIKINCDGAKEQGITYPSETMQRILMTELYEECKINPNSLSYLEAHGTGTTVGDPEECMAIDSVLTKNRKLPLLVGSVKSNIGHSEPSSGMSSIMKCILAFETGFIPPNIHYNTPKDEIKGLVEGRMKVVVDKTRFEDNRGLAAVNNFGFGGANCHLLLRWNHKEKTDNVLTNDTLPRLVCVSGRTEKAIATLFEELRDNEFNTEHIYLLHQVFRKNIPNHTYRGYIIVSKSGELRRSFRYFSGDNIPLYFTFGKLNNWSVIGNNLMVLPAFSASIQRIQKLLKKDIDISNILLNNAHDKERNHVLGSVAVQIGIIDILNLLGVKPTCCLGFSFGVLSAAYCDGSLNLEETINCALVINDYLDLMLSNDDNISQVNHAVNGDQVSNGNTVLNGIDTILDNLRLNLETHNLNNIQIRLRESLSRVLDNKNLCSNKTKNKSADYLINAVTNSVPQESKSIKLPSVIFEISSDPTYENVKGVSVISFTAVKRKNYVVAILEDLGSLYEYGYNPQITELYPNVDLPVSRGTRMISPYIRWNHNRNWLVRQRLTFAKEDICTCKIVKFAHKYWTFLTGHVIDGRNLFPATGYLFIVWETLTSLIYSSLDVTDVSFEDCKFIRAVPIPKKLVELKLSVIIQRETGKFEVIEGESAVVTGRITYKVNEPEITPFKQNTSLSNTLPLPLQKRDVYKELRLRGYNYKDEFCAIQDCDSVASSAHIKWNANWITFMDNMLQMKILQLDTRLLYVPTYIRKLTIEPHKHLTWIDDNYGSNNKTPCLPVFNDHSTGTISCGYIKIWGLTAQAISKRKYLGIPVLESYKFIPNVANLETHVSVRVMMQIILENILSLKVKVVELIDDYSEEGSFLTPIILTVLEDQPLVQPSAKILSKTPVEISNIEVEDTKLNTETDCSVVIGTNILGRPEIKKEAFEALKEKGFIISREYLDFDISATNHTDIEIIAVHKTATDSLVLFQTLSPLKKSITLPIYSSNEFSWMTKLKETIEKISNDAIVIYSENEPNSGILGLVNCLRREPSGGNIRCMFIMDTNQKLVPSKQQITAQLRKNMAFNVYKNGQWGTYRHILLTQVPEVEREHSRINISAIGDLSTINWVEGPLRSGEVHAVGKIAYIHYAALNFKDVMIAMGKIDASVMDLTRIEQENMLGIEFSGKDINGKRIMGLAGGALSNIVRLYSDDLTFDIPDDWSLDQAATVPVVYFTVVYAFYVRGEMKKGESILIHSGTGGVGLAAIRMALHSGCTVFTTVGTQEKREFLKEIFPQLKDDHIGNSRDESFEQMVYNGTNGRGVDMVLNSLAEDKLFASVRCLAMGGRFLEIGKYDMAKNNKLNLLLLKKEASYQGIMVDMFFKSTPEEKILIRKFVNEGIQSGAIQPLKRTIFKYNEVEQAFRLMASGKHMGKVLVEIRNTENDIAHTPTPKVHCSPRFSCHPEMVYIIAGGLGGFGLELADWLVLRGATKLVLTSRKGVSTGYQHYRIRIWQSYGIMVKISTSDITTKSGCQELIEESQELGPIDAIFNLAVILKDCIFENQTEETFRTAFGPKALATEYLDELSRKLCPVLRQFVIFSSLTCGRGNAGQTNYGMANSVMERICEHRKRDGYPALAVQWGAVGDVGLVAEMQEEHIELAIGGTLQQRISSCLQVLDSLLQQHDEVILSSMVVAEKRTGAGTAKTIVDAVVNILGVDIKTVSIHSTLVEIGMDSMTAMEIKQILEMDFDVTLTAKDMRTITLARLMEIQAEKEGTGQVRGQEVENITRTKFGLETIFRLIGPECDSRLLCKRLESNVEESAPAPKLIMFPGIEGFTTVYQQFATHLNAHAVCVQYLCPDNTTITSIVHSVLPIVEKYITKSEPFKFIAYSYGVMIALEVVGILESKGYTGSIICLDGSPSLFKEMSKRTNVASDEETQSTIIYQLIALLSLADPELNYKKKIFDCKNWGERLDILVEVTKDFNQLSVSYKRAVATGFYERLTNIATYEPSYGKLKTIAKLFKAEQATIQGFPDDYEISNLFENTVEVQTFAGNHTTLLDNELLVDTINLFVSN